MKTTISIITIIVIFFYIADTNIQFRPFKVTFGSLTSALAWVFFLISFLLMTYSIHSKAYKTGFEKGFESGKDLTIEVLKDIANENKK